MFDLLSDFVLALTWRSVLIGVLLFVATFCINLAIVSFILVKIPADHFSKSHKTKFWSGRNPALNAAKFIGKNILGVLLVVLGIVLSLPGVPGQGLLRIVLSRLVLSVLAVLVLLLSSGCGLFGAKKKIQVPQLNPHI